MDKIEQYFKDKYYDSDFKKYIKIVNKYWKIKNFFLKIPRTINSTILCWRYPFLKFDIKTGFVQKSCYYWCIDYGWRKAFGITMCEELRKALKRLGWLHKYQLSDVKEKFGELTIYDDGAPGEIHDIILKYEYISARTCHICGKLAKYRTKLNEYPYWIESYCEDCLKEKFAELPNVDEFYKDIDWYGWRK